MKIEQTFDVDAPPEDVWEFFHDDVEVVVRSIPGVEDFRTVGQDEYDVVMTQKVGHISATFELRAKLEQEEQLRSVEFSANGRTVKGAPATFQSRNLVTFDEVDAGGTRLHVVADVTIGGILGSMGHRVIASKAKKVTEEFAVNVTEAMAQR